MEKLGFEPEEARKILDLARELERESGFGDVILRIETKDGKVLEGAVVEEDGESSPGGVLLNEAGTAVRSEDMVSLGIGFAI